MRVAALFFAISMVLCLGVLTVAQNLTISRLVKEQAQLSLRMDRVVWVADAAVDTAVSETKGLKEHMAVINQRTIFIDSRLCKVEMKLGIGAIYDLE